MTDIADHAVEPKPMTSLASVTLEDTARALAGTAAHSAGAAPASEQQVEAVQPLAPQQGQVKPQVLPNTAQASSPGGVASTNTVSNTASTMPVKGSEGAGAPEDPFLATCLPGPHANVAFLSIPIHEQKRMRDELLKRSRETPKAQTGAFNPADVSPQEVNRKRPRTAVNPVEAHKCLLCGQTASYLCSYCCKAWYCSRDCQVDHWGDHQQTCMPEAGPGDDHDSITQRGSALYQQIMAQQQGRIVGPSSSPNTEAWRRSAQFADPGPGPADRPHEYAADRRPSVASQGAGRQGGASQPKSKEVCVVCTKEATCKCSVCGLHFYCSRDCQVVAWVTHKNVCRNSFAMS